VEIGSTIEIDIVLVQGLKNKLAPPEKIWPRAFHPFLHIPPFALGLFFLFTPSFALENSGSHSLQRPAEGFRLFVSGTCGLCFTKLVVNGLMVLQSQRDFRVVG
jgi:hypothetical protein